MGAYVVIARRRGVPMGPVPALIVINLVLGALLTTPEVFTQVFMAIALQFLFEISVLCLADSVLLKIC